MAPTCKGLRTAVLATASARSHICHSAGEGGTVIVPGCAMGGGRLCAGGEVAAKW